MRWSGWAIGILVAGSLVAGVVGALTAYAPPITPSDRLVGLTLNGPVAAIREGKRVELAPKGAVLTPEHVKAFAEAGVRRVRVKEFAVSRWTGLALFAGGVAGLGAGAIAVRLIRRPAATSGAAGGSYSEALARMEAEVVALKEIGSGEGWLRAVLDRIGAAQREDVPVIVGARRELTAKLGLAGYARFMDVFAAAERSVNRAWSSAADGHEAEARASLARAAELLAAARGRTSA
jgi:hypothetical protein